MQGAGSSNAKEKTDKTAEESGPLGEFSGLRGQLLVEAVFNKYGVGTMTLLGLGHVIWLGLYGMYGMSVCSTMPATPGL